MNTTYLNVREASGVPRPGSELDQDVLRRVIGLVEYVAVIFPTVSDVLESHSVDSQQSQDREITPYGLSWQISVKSMMKPISEQWLKRLLIAVP